MVKMSKPLEYYFENGTHVIFNKYVINTSGIVRSKKTGKVMTMYKSGNYNDDHYQIHVLR